MKLILIGNRGVGKTALLQRLQIYHSLQKKQISVYDLDREIEKSVKTSIPEIFTHQGESAFRQLEIELAQQLLRSPNVIVSLGAGFPLEALPRDAETRVVWVRRRATDGLGRIFLDRPRLDAQLSPLAEFHQRRAHREQRYLEACDWIYDLPEGLAAPSVTERQLFLDGFEDLGGILTLTAKHLERPNWFFQSAQYWGWDLIELRDDLLGIEQIRNVLQFLPPKQVLYSQRTTQWEHWREIRRNHPDVLADCALELGAPTPEADIVSLHDRNPNESLSACLQRLADCQPRCSHLKLAIEVHDFAELEQVLNWQNLDLNRRSILPRSSSGRWQWVRLWLKNRQLLNFVHSGFGDVPDQPSLSQWANTLSASPGGQHDFAAVLGFPVAHSHTPIEQGPFFKMHQASVFAIPLTESEWAVGFPLLQKMGLKWAAVTSPLKNLAYQDSVTDDPVTDRLQAANTLVRLDGHLQSINTDLFGITQLLELAGTRGPTVIWGGGGTLAALLEAAPDAVPYSSRTGEPRPGYAATEPETLIWAASPTAELPSLTWRPRQVVDLNYREDSRAQEYCQKTGARYFSGLIMFRSQAEAQRHFWEKYHGR